MILIADSGSTKTDWALVDRHQAVVEIKTKGLNPFQVSGDEIANEVRSSLLPHLPTVALDAVYFYGAGCTPEKQPAVEQALRSVLTVKGSCTVASDMLGRPLPSAVTSRVSPASLAQEAIHVLMTASAS